MDIAESLCFGVLKSRMTIVVRSTLRMIQEPATTSAVFVVLYWWQAYRLKEALPSLFLSAWSTGLQDLKIIFPSGCIWIRSKRPLKKYEVNSYEKINLLSCLGEKSTPYLNSCRLTELNFSLCERGQEIHATKLESIFLYYYLIISLK